MSSPSLGQHTTPTYLSLARVFSPAVAPLCSAAAPVTGLYFTSQSLCSPGYQWKWINTLFEAFFQIQSHSKLQHPSILCSSTKIPWVFVFLLVLLSIHNNAEGDHICSSTPSYPQNPKQRRDWSVFFQMPKGLRVFCQRHSCVLGSALVLPMKESDWRSVTLSLKERGWVRAAISLSLPAGQTDASRPDLILPFLSVSFGKVSIYLSISTDWDKPIWHMHYSRENQAHQTP